jgi:hypothetical protein
MPYGGVLKAGFSLVSIGASTGNFPGVVVNERTITDRCVAFASGIIKERISAGGGVAAAGGVAKKGERSSGRVLLANSVA